MPMYSWLRRMVPLAIALIVAVSAIAALGQCLARRAAGRHLERLDRRQPRQCAQACPHPHRRQRRRRPRAAGEISATCRGPLTLDSISGGYHHYLRKLARGATCAGGDIDCLKRAGANLYDSVTSHLGGEYDSAGTLRRGQYLTGPARGRADATQLPVCSRGRFEVRSHPRTCWACVSGGKAG